MKKHFTIVLIALCIGALCLFAYRSAQPSAQDDTPAQTTPKPIDPTAKSLSACLHMLGMADEDAAKVLGGGTEIHTPNGQFLLGRVYTAQMFSETAKFSTLYNSDAKVSKVNIQLQNTDKSVYEPQITALYGEPSARNDEGGTVTWTTDRGTMVLMQQENRCILEMTA